MAKGGKMWLAADLHLGHTNICKFLKNDGSKVRPWDSVEEMDEAIVDNWNSLVSPKDRVNILGDVVINRKALKTVSRLNGRLRLIAGNHDIFSVNDYIEAGFGDIKGYLVRNGMIMSHIPVHEESLARFGCNIHGHTHSNRVMKRVMNFKGEYDEVIDARYHCVSMEHIDFKPILFEDVLERIKEEGGQIGFKNGNGAN